MNCMLIMLDLYYTITKLKSNLIYYLCTMLRNVKKNDCKCLNSIHNIIVMDIKRLSNVI